MAEGRGRGADSGRGDGHGRAGLPGHRVRAARPTARQLPKVAELAASLPQITECHRITGEDCFLLKMHAAAVEQVEEILDQFLIYGQTVSSIVVSTPVPLRPLPVPQAS